MGGHLSDALRRGAGCFDQAFYVGANRFDLSYIEVRPGSGFIRHMQRSEWCLAYRSSMCNAAGLQGSSSETCPMMQFFEERESRRSRTLNHGLKPCRL